MKSEWYDVYRTRYTCSEKEYLTIRDKLKSGARIVSFDDIGDEYILVVEFIREWEKKEL